MGVSGGENGARHGPSMMPGGDRDGYEELAPILTKIAAQHPDGPCVTYIGPGGSGHYVKMVHNGIEYGDMQLIAEAYDVLKTLGGLSNAELADVFDEWNQGELAELPHRDHGQDLPQEGSRRARATSSTRSSTRRRRRAPASGRCRTPPSSARRCRPSPRRVDARVISSRRAIACTPRSSSPGPTPGAAAGVDKKTARRRRARRALRRQGVQLRAGHEPAPRRLGDARAGASTSASSRASGRRAASSARSSSAASRPRTTATPTSRTCSSIPSFRDEIAHAAGRAGAASSRRRRRPACRCSTTGASLGYYDMIRRERLPANLTQAQRDFFGAHTYQRVDRERRHPHRLERAG